MVWLWRRQGPKPKTHSPGDTKSVGTGNRRCCTSKYDDEGEGGERGAVLCTLLRKGAM